MHREVRDFDDLAAPVDRFAYELYHEQCRLNEFTAPQFTRRIVDYTEALIDHRPKEHVATGEVLMLPRKSRWRRGSSLTDVLHRRRSRRAFAPGPIALQQLGTILDQACAAKTSSESDRSLRPFPSAGEMYPVDVFILSLAVADLAAGCYRYDPHQHALETLGTHATPLTNLVESAEEYDHVATAVLLTVDVTESAKKYGEHAYRFALLEAGHVAQNLLLLAEDIRLAALPLGGLRDDMLNSVFGLGSHQWPVYLLAMGKQV